MAVNRKGFFGRQFRRVIEWEEQYSVGSNAILVHKYPLEGKSEIMRKSTLVVREGQKALMINEGKLTDSFEPGTYTLDDIANIPILSELYHWKEAWELPCKVDIFFINTRQFLDLKWGTATPVLMRDKEFGAIRLKGYGTFSISACDAEKMLKELFGSMNLIKVGDVENYLKKIVVSKISDVIAESQIAAMDLSMHYDELGAKAFDILKPEFEQWGLTLRSFYIQNLSLPANVEEAIDKRSQVGVMSGVIGDYTQLQAAEAIREAARNEGGVAGMGVGLGAGLGIGQQFSQAMSASNEAKDAKIRCPKCGALNKESAKFCSKCGQALEEKKKTKECVKCKEAIAEDAKFCPICGAKQANTCPKCGVENKAGAKFCSECGEKL